MRTVSIEWAPGAAVTGVFDGPAGAGTGVLLAHGAGGGQQHPFMVGLRGRLAGRGMAVLTFDYPYMEAGRRAPDRLARLLECHTAAHRVLAKNVDRVVVVGKSMGGRVGGHLVAGRTAVASALVFLGYPLIPLGKGEPRSTAHLAACAVPMLFIQGERDRLGPPDAVATVVAGLAHAEMAVVADADHGFAVPKRTGLTADDVLDRLAELTARFAG